MKEFHFKSYFANPTTRHGFTIVELLIVVVVIAILAAITIVAYNGITTQANDSARQADATNIKKKMEMYRATADTYALGGTPTSRNQALSEYNLESLSGSLIVCGYDDCPTAPSSEWNRNKLYILINDGLSVGYWSNKDGIWKNTQYFEGDSWDYETSTEDGPLYLGAPETN